MMRSSVCASLLAAVASTSAWAQNVALNKPVTIVSGVGSTFGAASPAVVTDGVFLGENTAYGSDAADSGSIRWNPGIAGATTIEIQLGAVYTIDAIIVQADDNDSLTVTYLDGNGVFQHLYTVEYVSVGWGFKTRPSGDQTTWAPLTPVDTKTIRVTHLGGDGYYGISELKLRGVIACAADYNADTIPDVLDFLDFFDDFGQCDQLPGPCGSFGNADFNGDTTVDVLDFLDFFDAFGQGC